jgi:thiol-disulfide isomerase/thioredoxin
MRAGWVVLYSSLIIAPLALIGVSLRAGAPPTAKATDAKDAKAESKKEKAKRPPIYNEKADAKADIAAALKSARIDEKRVLVTFGGNWCGWCYKLHGLFHDDHELAKIIRNEFVPVLVDFRSNVELFNHYVPKKEQHGFPFLTVLNADGTVAKNQETGALEEGPKHDPKKVKAFLEKWSLTHGDAEKVFANGMAQAKRESKRVFFHVGAPWCGWCRVLDRFLDDNSSLFASDFINLKIDPDRMAHAEQIIKQYRPEKSFGIPWMAILDADGKVLATSDAPSTGNIGYPGSPEEIRHFMGMLRKTAQHSTPQQLDLIEKKLNEARELRERAKAAATAARSTKPRA